jgi:hypothetical protein
MLVCTTAETRNHNKKKTFNLEIGGARGEGQISDFDKRLQRKLKLSFAPSWRRRPVFQSGRFPLEQQLLPLSVTCLFGPTHSLLKVMDMAHRSEENGPNHSARPEQTWVYT